MYMRYWHRTLLTLTLAATGWSEENQLQKAKFTDVVNDVNITSVDKKEVRSAKVNDLFAVPEIVKTGPDSRAELQADDKTITRVGSNTIFSFDKDKRTINLESGSVLFHSPKGMGGGTIKTAAATAAVTGTTIMVGATSNGGFKLLVLEGKSKVTMANGRVQNLLGGQMTFIVPGATTPPPVITFRLGSQTEGSKLVNGFDQPLASLPKIQEVTARQEKMIASGRMEGTQLVVGDAKDRKGAQVIDTALLQNSVTAGSFEALTAYLDGRFSRGPFTLSGAPPSQDIFKSQGGASGVFQGQDIDRNKEGFALFAAQSLTIGSPTIDLGFANGFKTAALVGQGNINIPQAVQFNNFSRNLLINSFEGQILFPNNPGSLQIIGFNGESMNFESKQFIDIQGGTTTKNIEFSNPAGEIKFTTSQSMNIIGVSFNSTKVFLSGDTVNLENINFGSASRVDIYSRNGQYVISTTSPIGRTDGHVNLFFSGIIGTAASGYNSGPTNTPQAAGQVGTSQIFTAVKTN